METSIQIKMDQHKIAGILHMPEHTKEEKIPLVIICHGFIGSKVGQHRLFVHAARELCQAGFAVLRFDYIGCGESTGEYHRTTVTQQINETLKVIDYAVTLGQIDLQRIVLLGHSLGGGIASMVAGQDKRVNKLVLWSPVAVPQQDIFGILGRKLYHECLKQGTVNYQGFVLGREFLRSLAEISPVNKIQEFPGDILIIHGDQDVETPITNTQLYDLALTQRQQGSYEISVIVDADHTYSSPVWEQEAIDTTIHWLSTEKANSKSA
jgi:pimeloyl-ACP methyl ester carboxylesterase